MQPRGSVERESREVILGATTRAGAALGWIVVVISARHPTASHVVVPWLLPIAVLWSIASFVRMAYRAKAVILVGGMVYMTVVGLLFFGTVPGPFMLGISAAVQASLYFRQRTAFAVSILTAATTLLSGYLHATGRLPEHLSLVAPSMFENWLRFAFTFVFCSVTAVMASAYLVSRYERELAESKALLEALQAEQARRAELEAERLRVQASVQEAQKLEALGRLAGGVAHDFQNHLAVIVAWTDLMRARKSPDVQEQGLAAIDEAGRQAASMVRSLLAVARREAATPVRLDISAIVESSMRALRSLLQDSIDLRLALAPVPAVLADESAVGRILMNLVVNARDAMPEGGNLRIETRLVPAGSAPDTAPDPQRSYVELVVADSGVGMDEATRARIFEPFFSTKGSAGTGLGLATVLGSALQAGGYVTVDSAPGRGASFHVGWPVVVDAAN